MRKRFIAGSLLALMGIGLFWNQAFAGPERWVVGIAMGLPFVLAGLGVVAGNRRAGWAGMVLAGIGFVAAAFVAVQANQPFESPFRYVLDFFGSEGCYTCFDVFLDAAGFVLASLLAAALLAFGLLGPQADWPPEQS